MAEAAASDHDLLIRIDAKLEGLTTDLKDFKNTSIQQITELYRTKAPKSELESLQEGFESTASKAEVKELKEDHEPRIRFLEKYGWMAIGGLTIIQAALYILHTHFLGGR